MNRREYIRTVLEQLEAGQGADGSATRAAFISAALAIIEVVESPLKEEALVSLAMMSLGTAERAPGNSKKAA